MEAEEPFFLAFAGSAAFFFAETDTSLDLEDEVPGEVFLTSFLCTSSLRLAVLSLSSTLALRTSFSLTSSTLALRTRLSSVIFSLFSLSLLEADLPLVAEEPVALSLSCLRLTSSLIPAFG